MGEGGKATLFPNKVTFRGSSWTHLSRGTISPPPAGMFEVSAPTGMLWVGSQERHSPDPCFWGCQQAGRSEREPGGRGLWMEQRREAEGLLCFGLRQRGASRQGEEGLVREEGNAGGGRRAWASELKAAESPSSLVTRLSLARPVSVVSFNVSPVPCLPVNWMWDLRGESASGWFHHQDAKFKPGVAVLTAAPLTGKFCFLLWTRE